MDYGNMLADTVWDRPLDVVRLACVLLKESLRILERHISVYPSPIVTELMLSNTRICEPTFDDTCGLSSRCNQCSGLISGKMLTITRTERVRNVTQGAFQKTGVGCFKSDGELDQGREARRCGKDEREERQERHDNILLQ